MTGQAAKDKFWSDIHPNQALERLFPDAADFTSLKDMGMPGRYWIAWDKPPDATALDKIIYKLTLRKRNPKLINRVDLYKERIYCPIYAWRVHTFYAAQAAYELCQDLDQDRLDKLGDEIVFWSKRIYASKGILKSLGDREFFEGGTELSNKYDLEDKERLVEYTFRKERRFEIANQIEQDNRVIEGLKREVGRIKDLRSGRSGFQQPSYWRSIFFQFMASLWVTTTGQNISSAATPYLRDILEAATKVIGNIDDDEPNKCTPLMIQTTAEIIDEESAGISEWGQARSLHKKFKTSPSGEGFRIGEGGLFGLNGKEDISNRGLEIYKLCLAAEGEFDHPPLFQCMVCAALNLIDYREGDLATIMREIVVKPQLSEFGVFSAHLQVQLGWIRKIEAADLDLAVKRSVAAARTGDAAAAVVVEVAHAFSPAAREAIDVLGWPNLYAGIGEDVIHKRYVELAEASNLDDIISDDDWAFVSAYMIVEVIGERD